MTNRYYPGSIYGIPDFDLVEGLYRPRRNTDIKIYNVDSEKCNRVLLNNIYQFEEERAKNGYVCMSILITSNTKSLFNNLNIPEYLDTISISKIDGIDGYIKGILPNNLGQWEMWVYLFFNLNIDIKDIYTKTDTVYKNIQSLLSDQYSISVDTLHPDSLHLQAVYDDIETRNKMRSHLKYLSYVNDVTEDYTRYTGFKSYITIKTY